MQAERLRVALARKRFERRAAGVTEAEHAGDLVERFARSVIPRAAEEREGTIVFHAHDVAVPAGGHEAHERRL